MEPHRAGKRFIVDDSPSIRGECLRTRSLHLIPASAPTRLRPHGVAMTDESRNLSDDELRALGQYVRSR
jgi:hypothetical protein